MTSLALDIAVVGTELHLGTPDPCEAYASSQKHRKYDAGFVNSNYGDKVP